MNMNKIFAKGSLVIGALLVFAVPALPDTITFGFSNSCPTASTCATGVALTNSAGVNYLTQFFGTVSTITSTGGTGTGGATDVLTLTGGTLTMGPATAGSVNSFVLGGTITCSFCSSGSINLTSSNLLTIVENPSTATSSGAGASVTYGAVTSLSSVNATLAAFLGIASPIRQRPSRVPITESR